MEVSQPVNHDSLLMRLLLKDDEQFKAPSDPKPMRLMVAEPPQKYRPVKIEPYAENYWPHGGAGFNYNEWSPLDVYFFLDSVLPSHNKIILKMLNKNCTGSSLYSCFLDTETSELFRRKIGYSVGLAMKLRMALGNIHNNFYNLI